MSAYLLAISVGPVQDFIAAARRTRDLWFGSYLLSEISKAVALTVHEKLQGTEGQLIFPAPENPTLELEKQSDLNVANIILVELQQQDPKSLSNDARQAAIQCWRTFADDALRKAAEFVDTDVWNQQIDDVLEFYSAWVPLPSTADYASARRRVMRLLSGRKACRSFKPASGYWGKPKSSLDGARETIWKKSSVDEIQKRTRTLHLAPGEQLDVVGLTKRQGGGVHSYPSVSRIAADPWLRGLQQTNPAKLDELKQQCQNLGYAGMVGINTSRWPQYNAFPFEGSALYPTRYKELIQENRVPHDTFDGLASLMANLHKGQGQPLPYLAMLVADGDRMGQVITNIKNPDKHREFSQQLSGFAALARTVVADHFGCLIYAGGDDVMALLPLDQCLLCSRALHDRFGELVNEWGTAKTPSPTLSAGIAIGHFMAPLEDLLSWARQAEKSAKQPDRDGLAVHLHPRGGAPLAIRGRWSDAFDQRLLTWANNLAQDELPDRAAYDLRQLAIDYANWPDEENTRQAIYADLNRVLRKKQTKGASLDPILVESALQHCAIAPNSSQAFNAGVMGLASEWLVARYLARAQRQAEQKTALAKEAI
ncbi:MAG: type III-B CRISPR-associated protein Cas10/Cmr2 [Gammaproteobacteria bacterium]|nr:type III-B CRISPR-associated protein Cas10/Cmr2 [Gammaproteobacteria bacterium]